jgi:hypothetical protein
MQINQQILDNLIGHKLLTSWEHGFIESVANQFKKRKSLSSNQERIVKRCIDKTSPEKQDDWDNWTKEFDAEKRKNALLCARYYKKEGYFTGLSNQILDDENFVPTREQYTKMCENKYAKRVIQNSQTPFAFDLGDLARVRKTINHNHLAAANGSMLFHYTKMKDQAVIIIDQTDSKKEPSQYKTVCCSLIANPSIRFWCEERKLKKFKGV